MAVNVLACFCTNVLACRSIIAENKFSNMTFVKFYETVLCA